MNIYLIIAKSTIKMYFRRTQSLFWTLFFPVVMMLGIGFFGFGQFTPPKLGIINYSNNYESDLFLEELNKFSSEIKFKVSKDWTAKFLPNLKFIFDESFDYAERIEKLIKKNKSK